MPRQRKILVLTKDVKNPKPDGRAKSTVWAEKMWPKDSLWCFTSSTDRAGEPLEHLDSLTRWGMFGDITRFGCIPQWNTLAQNGLNVCFTPYVFDPLNYSQREFQALQMRYRFDFDLVAKYLFAFAIVDRQVLVTAQQRIDEMEDSDDIWKR